MKVPSAELMSKPCVKCGVTNRTSNGQCAACKAEYRKLIKGTPAYRKVQSRHNEKKLLKRRIERESRPPIDRSICRRCGASDRMKDGSCKACYDRKRIELQANWACSRCGGRKRTKSGQCRACIDAKVAARRAIPCKMCGGTEKDSKSRCVQCRDAALNRHISSRQKAKRDGTYVESERTKARRKRWRSENEERERKLRKAWYEAHKNTPGYRNMVRARMLYVEYGLTIEQHDKMLEEHAGRCAICKHKRKLHIDHDHETGKVRGLLCHYCNLILGLAKDSSAQLRSAARYLDRQKAPTLCEVLPLFANAPRGQ